MVEKTTKKIKKVKDVLVETAKDILRIDPDVEVNYDILLKVINDYLCESPWYDSLNQNLDDVLALIPKLNEKNSEEVKKKLLVFAEENKNKNHESSLKIYDFFNQTAELNSLVSDLFSEVPSAGIDYLLQKNQPLKAISFLMDEEMFFEAYNLFEDSCTGDKELFDKICKGVLDKYSDKAVLFSRTNHIADKLILKKNHELAIRLVEAKKNNSNNAFEIRSCLEKLVDLYSITNDSENLEITENALISLYKRTKSWSALALFYEKKGDFKQAVNNFLNTDNKEYLKKAVVLCKQNEFVNELEKLRYKLIGLSVRSNKKSQGIEDFSMSAEDIYKNTGLEKYFKKKE